jgi:amidase
MPEVSLADARCGVHFPLMIRTRLAILSVLSALSVPAGVARAQGFDVTEATIATTHEALRAGRTTCRAVVQQYLDRIAAYDKQGPTLNAIQNVNPRALLEADSLDAVMRARRPIGALHCVTVMLKDQIETRDMPTTYGSSIFKDFTPQRYVGSASGIIRNAYDPTRNPSGSSGGSATGVAANFGLVGIGEDTGGSIRGPAAVSALVGLRPTLSLISRHGMLPANPTQDTMGPMTRTVADAARVLDVIAGYDANDPITSETIGRLPQSYSTALRADALRGARVGVMRSNRRSSDTSAAGQSVNAEFAKVGVLFDRALADLRTLGATVVDSLQIPILTQGGGVGNNFETEQATNAYFAQHPNAPVKTLREILLSGEVNPWRARSLIGEVGRTTNDPGYLQVLLRREQMRVGVLKAMADHRLDAIIYMTYDAPPTVIAPDVLTNPRPQDNYGRGDNRGLSPQIGFPALTVPAGFTSDSLPAGLEFLGRPFSEPQLLGFAFAYEQATKHRRAPTTVPRVR